MIPFNESNAADHYRRAVVSLPKFNASELRSIENFRIVSLNRTVQEWIARAEPALEEMRRGAASISCDWGVDLIQASTNGPGNDMLMNLSRLSQMACLRARLGFQQEKPKVALEDVIAVIVLGRHVGRKGPLMAKITGIAIEGRAIEVGAAHLPEQNGQILKDLGAQLMRLAPPGTLKEAMHGEKEFCRLFIRPKFQKMNVEDAIKHIRETEPQEDSEAILAAAGGTKEGLLSLVDRAGEMHDALGQIFMLPENQFPAALNGCRRQYEARSPLALSVLSYAEGVRYAADRSAICFDMLRAAVAILVDGPEKLQEYRDLFGDGPFAYRPFKGGFELNSKLASRNRPPALLMVGKDRSYSGAIRRFCTALLRRIGRSLPS